jgi:hypothetical protein
MEKKPLVDLTESNFVLSFNLKLLTEQNVVPFVNAVATRMLPALLTAKCRSGRLATLDVVVVFREEVSFEHQLVLV